MPRFDRTGPEGQGPMTGGKRGRCLSSGRNDTRDSSSTYVGAGRGGISRGCGRGKQWGRIARIGRPGQFQTSDQNAF